MIVDPARNMNSETAYSLRANGRDKKAKAPLRGGHHWEVSASVVELKDYCHTVMG